MLEQGKIYKVTISFYEKERTYAICITNIEKSRYDEDIYHYDAITSCGGELSFTSKQIVKISSTRLAPEVRKAMTDIAKLTTKELKIREELKVLQTEIYQKKEYIFENSEDLSNEQFVKLINNNLNRSTYDESLFCSSVHDNKVYITQEIFCDEYISPTAYPFIYQEYDMTLHIDPGEKGSEIEKSYKKALRNLLPPVVSAFNFGKINYEYLTLGDKNTLIAAREYVFKIKKATRTEALNLLKKIN